MIEPVTAIIINSLCKHLYFFYVGRYNLDPSGQCLEAALWQVLERAGIKDTVLALPQQLESTTKGFGIGQRQVQYFTTVDEYYQILM